MDERLKRARQNLAHELGLENPALTVEFGEEVGEKLRTALEELHVAEEELRAQNEELQGSYDVLDRERRLFRDLFDNAPVGYLLTDGQGNIEELNRAVLELSGRAREALLMQPVFVLFSIAERRTVRQALRELRETGLPRQVEVNVLGPGGGEITVEIRLNRSPLDEASVRWLMYDLTERKRAEMADRVEVDRALEVQEQLTSLISHELRTPLTLIRGNADMLAERFDALSEDELEQTIGAIQEQSHHLESTINNMLALKQGAERLPLEPILLQRVVPGMLRRAGLRLQDRDVRLTADSELPPVLAHVGYIEQILTNYLSNADKYSPAGTPINVRVERDGDDGVLLVEDQGAGIPPSERERVFQSFFRSATVEGKTRGVGLGLSVCRLLAEAQHGEVWARAREGGGSIFGLRLALLLSE